MDFPCIKAITIPQGVVTKIESAGKILWQTITFKNWARYSINEDGTIYNNGKGYKDGYRIRSGGTETTATSASCTGFIPVKSGSVVRISGDITFNQTAAENAINVADSSFTNIGQAARNSNYGIFASAYSAYGNSSIVEESSGIWRWVVPPAESGVAYIRVTVQAKGNAESLIVTVDEEIS